jgi:hypothetical protein
MVVLTLGCLELLRPLTHLTGELFNGADIDDGPLRTQWYAERAESETK